MEPALGDGQRVKGGEGPLPNTVGKGGVTHQRHDVPGGAHHRGVLDADVHLGATESVAQHRLRLKRPAANPETFTDAADLVEVGTGVHEGTKGHVAGDAGETVEPRHRGRLAHKAIPSVSAERSRSMTPT